jgi:hypothetical protein
MHVTSPSLLPVDNMVGEVLESAYRKLRYDIWSVKGCRKAVWEESFRLYIEEDVSGSAATEVACFHLVHNSRVRSLEASTNVSMTHLGHSFRNRDGDLGRIPGRVCLVGDDSESAANANHLVRHTIFACRTTLSRFRHSSARHVQDHELRYK